jgi:hypothetical protein
MKNIFSFWDKNSFWEAMSVVNLILAIIILILAFVTVFVGIGWL